jgi:hypothetical protein
MLWLAAKALDMAARQLSDSYEEACATEAMSLALQVRELVDDLQSRCLTPES